MTKLILGLAAALMPMSAAVESMQNSPRKLNLLLAAVTAGLIGLALIMPGDW